MLGSLTVRHARTLSEAGISAHDRTLSLQAPREAGCLTSPRRSRHRRSSGGATTWPCSDHRLIPAGRRHEPRRCRARRRPARAGSWCPRSAASPGSDRGYGSGRTPRRGPVLRELSCVRATPTRRASSLTMTSRAETVELTRDRTGRSWPHGQDHGVSGLRPRGSGSSPPQVVRRLLTGVTVPRVFSTSYRSSSRGRS